MNQVLNLRRTQSLFLLLSLIFGSVFFLTPLAHATESAALYRLRIEGQSQMWIGARPVQGALSLVRTESSATRWLFHKQIDGSFTIESQDDGKRWLFLDAEGSVGLASSDSGLSTRWIVHGGAEQIVLENKAWPKDERFLVADASGFYVGTREAAENAALLKVAQERIELPFAHGDVIALRSLARGGDRILMDGNTTNGAIGLTPLANAGASGAIWRVHDNQDGSFSFECLGNIAGRRWLKVGGDVPILANTSDRNESTRWKVFVGPLGSIALKNVSIKAANVWLDSYPVMGSTALAPHSSKEYPGTSWAVEIRKKFDPSVQGRWSAVETFPVSGIHTHVLPDGKVLSWSRYMDPTDIGSTVEGVRIGGQSTMLWDPLTASAKPVPNSEVDTFCSGHAFLPDGRLLVTGGHLRSNVGPKSTQIYDFRTEKWETSAAWDMNGGRWYPTNISLANGDIITVSGDATSNEDKNRIPQVWSAAQNSWRDLTGLQSSCFNEGSGPCMPLYPWLHLSPKNGQVFVSGPGKETGYILTKNQGAWVPIAKTNQGYRGDYEATSIMYAPGKIMIAGGVPSTNSVELIDLNHKDPSWVQSTPMLSPRHKLMSTLLADGSVFVSGGTQLDSNLDDGAVFATELWDESNKTWTEGDHLAVPRLYHASTVLLADGRVLSLGGGLGAGYVTHKNLQVYAPPYLFRGVRPEAAIAKERVKYGETLHVKTRDAKEIHKVHMIRLSSDTHSFNSTQHIAPLAFRAGPRGLHVTLPSSGKLAPPGYYWLFIVNKKGVPSIGKAIQIL